VAHPEVVATYVVVHEFVELARDDAPCSALVWSVTARVPGIIESADAANAKNIHE
jgi:hypothetical protein